MNQIKVKKPNAILFDISGTVARESFGEKILLPYFKIAYHVYMENSWLKQEWQDCLKELSATAARDPEAPKINLNQEKSEITDQACKYIEFCLEKNRESKAFAVFRFLVWFDGYERGKINTPVYSDVVVMLQRWKCNRNLKLYVLSNGWLEASKKFMSQTSHGNLNLIIDDHFDDSIGSLKDPETYLKVAQRINQKTNDLLFLTKSPEEAMTARKAGLDVVLVLTRSPAVNRAMEICKDIPIARAFTEIDLI